jgi:dTDP-4-amino-4,6-dideoxygalactose transaminase
MNNDPLKKIIFNQPLLINKEIDYIFDAIKNQKKISGDGFYTAKSRQFLKNYLDAKDVLLTHSCTAALEMSAILLDLKEGDEVIMPSYTFVSTANPFVLRGAIPVFVDISLNNLNIDENLIEQAITKKTKAIAVVHYGGVACEMDKIMAIAKKYNLFVIEDAAQALGSKYKGKHLGTIGDLGCLSFHETKNIISGEGGALIINQESYLDRAEIIREKGTNRSKFFQGQIDKYTWVDIGSSFLPSDIIAAYLYCQLENIEKINNRRIKIWHFYDQIFKQYAIKGYIQTSKIPDDCDFNAHLYYVLFNDEKVRNNFIEFCKQNSIMAIFHYVPLHDSPAGLKYGKTPFDMVFTNKASKTLVRMPLFYDLEDDQLDYIANKIEQFFTRKDFL